MPAGSKVAVLVCVAGAPGEGPERRLLGLTVGERLLLALAHRGFEAVVFVGDGPRPRSERAGLRELRIEDLDRSRSHLIVPSDAVFDDQLLVGELPDGLPLTCARGDALETWLEDPERALAGRAGSGGGGGRGFALRVRGRETAARARRALLRSLRKPIDGVVSRHLNRHVSLFLTRFLVDTGIRPNAFTVAFMVVGVAAGGVAAAFPSGWGLVVAAALFQAQSILDGCDGEMARLTYRFSKQGQWLDSIGDDLTNYSFCLGLAVGQAQLLGRPSLFWLGGLTLAMQLVASGLCYRRMIQLGTGDLLALPDLVTPGGGEGRLSRLGAMVRPLFKRDSFALILATVTAAQLPVLAFYLFALGTAAVLGGVIVNERRLARLEAESAPLRLA